MRRGFTESPSLVPYVLEPHSARPFTSIRRVRMLALSRTVAEALLDRLLDAFPPERPYARAAYEQAPMPGAIAHFLDYVLQQLTRREAIAVQQACASEWFDDEHPRVERALQVLLSALGEHAHIPAARWSSLLGEAVRRVVAYLAEPRRTLVEFIFEDDEPRSVSVIREQMAAFAPYPYLWEGVEAYVRREQVDTLAPDPFEELLRRIDRRTTEDYDAEAWLRLLDPLYRLVEQALPETEGVPVPLLGAFFSEKGNRRAVRRLREVHEQREADALSAEALYRLLEAPEPTAPTPLRTAPLPDADEETPPPAAPPASPDEDTVTVEAKEALSSPRPEAAQEAPPPPRPETPAQEAVPTDAVPEREEVSVANGTPAEEETSPSPKPSQERTPTDEPAPSPEPSEVTAGPPTPGSPDESVPLWKQFQKGIQRAPATGERVVQQKRQGFHSTPDIERQDDEPAPTNEASPHSLPRWMQYRESNGDEDEDGVSLDVLERSVLGPSGPRNRDLFLDELFDGDKDDYARTLHRLLGAPSWSEASQIIAEDVFRKHQVNIYSDPAVLFTDAVELRYRR